MDSIRLQGGRSAEAPEPHSVHFSGRLGSNNSNTTGLSKYETLARLSEPSQLMPTVTPHINVKLGPQNLLSLPLSYSNS